MIMKELTKKVFYCDHCKKHGLSKGSMSKHEKWCNYNPENRRACEGCINLEEVPIKYLYDSDEYGVYTKEAKGFRCKILDKILYPLKVERKDLINRFPKTFENQERMPKICEHHKNELDYIFQP